MNHQDEPYYSVERRKEVRDTARKLRKQFLKYQEAEIVYSMSHRKIMQLAQEAGAIYRMDSTVCPKCLVKKRLTFITHLTPEEPAEVMVSITRKQVKN